MSTLTRWTSKLADRKKLLAAARGSVAYWARRAGSARGKGMLEQAKARRALRNRQVETAERVVARHSRHTGEVSDVGVAFVAGFEGFSATIYRDAVGVETQGYGETENLTSKPWTRAYALARLRLRLDRDYLRPILELCERIGLHLAQNEEDALASAVYNLGPGILDAGHTMGEALRSKNRQRIADAFLVYDKAGGHTLPGLTRRRRAERALYLKHA